MACNSCNYCMTLCQVKGCQLASQFATFTWPEVQRDDIIIKKITPAVIQANANALTSAASKGTKQDSRPENFSPITKEFMYASDINRFLTHMTHGLLYGSKPGTKTRDEIIYASYFNDIRNALLNNIKIYSYACDWPCNSSSCNSSLSC